MEKLNEVILEVGIKVARRGEGGLVIVGNCKYKPLVKQDVKPFNVIDNPKLLESLILMDGAVVLNSSGILEVYGAKINSNNILPNFGTRHSAAISASMNKGTTAYIISQEDKKVKVFYSGKLILQIDSLEKGIEKKVSEISKLFESMGFGTLGFLGASVLVPTLGIALIPGVIVFGGVHYIINQIKNFERGK
ncbi:MAG: DNA integrity scanning protein DisA nucleotide-binding domain protein [Candidatus Omnitrophica bacterium]|jgi:DNA integrity scanning protein DisA with diadenylate cyclase activity|nr:DNA integrity scanning protein DisA nucleotide-binding domain protein [Candidatus Omnitrophota bacterium]